MCLQYWPLTRFMFGDIDVETINTQTYAHFNLFFSVCECRKLPNSLMEQLYKSVPLTDDVKYTTLTHFILVSDEMKRNDEK
ncbi:hypothetical protein DICVIV_10273 [Dictyocaulus viviparus]|uniref:Uncharacterized protein n=1 Tax=Dictyocaulus viviparus TaxID=29172 RepID=A0A0D8XIW4_DICVI|nr:hypothetical protein DICVIV_10273 [Dictyocaulus viviparus]